MRKIVRDWKHSSGKWEFGLLQAACAALITVMSGCDSGEPALRPQDEPELSAEAVREVVLAVHPYASPVELVSQFAPLLAHVRRETGLALTFSVSEDYETHIARMGNEEVDIAFMGPAPYVSMSEQYGPKPLLCCFEEEGSRGFRGYVIVRNDNPAVSLNDLEGKSFASSSRKSTMSYVIPRYMFIQAGVPFPETRLRIVNSHNNVCLNVLAGDINAGAVKAETYLKYRDRNLKAIATTPEVVTHAFVAASNMDPEILDRIKSALLAIRGHDQVRKLLIPIKETLTGLVPVDDSDFDLLRAIMAAVRADEERSTEEGVQAR